MTSARTISTLNRLVALHNRSLASYLSYASPTWKLGDEQAKQTLDLITAQQKEVVDRIGPLIDEAGGIVDYGAYPMSFTGLHDLSSEYLIGQLILDQQRIVSAIEDGVRELSGDATACELAQEALGMAKGHLDLLTELKPSAAA